MKITSPVLEHMLQHHPAMDHAGYLEFEFGGRVEVNHALFHELVSSASDITAPLARLVPDKGLIVVMRFLGVAVNASSIADIRAMDVDNSPVKTAEREGVAVRAAWNQPRGQAQATSW